MEHIKLHEEYDGQQFVVEFDFLGKDSIRYYNRVEVEKRVFKNLQLFMENKQEGDDLFDRLNVIISQLSSRNDLYCVVDWNVIPYYTIRYCTSYSSKAGGVMRLFVMSRNTLTLM